jgi:hypothetical protein
MAQIDQSRRDALKKLGIATGVGAAATTEWAKPVVNSIIVPAHAQTTSGSSGGGGGGTGVGLPIPAGTYTIGGFGGQYSFTIPSNVTGANDVTLTDVGGGTWWTTPATKVDIVLLAAGQPSGTGPTTGGTWTSITPSGYSGFDTWFFASNGSQ